MFSRVFESSEKLFLFGSDPSSESASSLALASPPLNTDPSNPESVDPGISTFPSRTEEEEEVAKSPNAISSTRRSASGASFVASSAGVVSNRTRTFAARTVIPRTASRTASRTAATRVATSLAAAGAPARAFLFSFLFSGGRWFGGSSAGSSERFAARKKSGFGPTTSSSDSSSTAMGSAPRACHGMTARRRATLPSRHVTGTTSPSFRRRYDPRSAASRISNVPERSATSSWSASRSSKASPSARRSANANTRRKAHAYARPSIVIVTETTL